MTDQIKKVTLKNGRTRYRFVVDISRDPVTGKRQQKTYTFDLKREAVAELARIKSETAQGTHVRPSEMTLNQHLDEWLPPVVRYLEASSTRNYVDALRPARERLGDKQLQKITKDDIEQLVTWMCTSGRRRGGQPGTGLSRRTVALTLGRLTAALETAVAEGKLVRNVAKLVKPPRKTEQDEQERETWSMDQVRQFLGTASKERLHAAWRMSLYGLRRGEVLGLRWPVVTWGSFAEACTAHREKWCEPCYGVGEDHQPTTIRIEKTRVLVEYKVIEKDPKSRNGKRTLPLDAITATALRALWVHQATEKLAAGTAYADTGWVVVDELGEPMHPEWYSDEFERVRKRAGAPRIVLHGARHTAISLMEKAQVPISIISKWAGHYDVKFTYSRYVHAGEEDLREGTAALAALYKIS
jgi:integrase